MESFYNCIVVLDLLKEEVDLKKQSHLADDLIRSVDQFFHDTSGSNYFVSNLVNKVLVALKMKSDSIQIAPNVSRSQVKDQKTKILLKTNLERCLFKLVKIYKGQIRNSDFYYELQIEGKSEVESILNLEVSLLVIQQSLESFESLIDHNILKILKYYDKQFRINDTPKFQQELFTFFKEVDLKITYSTENSNTTHLERCKLDVEKDIDIDLLFNVVQEFKFYSLYLDKMANLKDKLCEKFIFLKGLNSVDLKTTVFGDKNYSKIDQLYDDLYSLIEIEPSKEEFINVFSLSSKSSIKVNLKNKYGAKLKFTLSDYGYLITALQEFFKDKLHESTEYNKWWAKNFKFEGVEKSVEDVRRMRSNASHALDRKPKNKVEIDAITQRLQ